LCAVAAVELAEDAADVRFRGQRADHEPARDLRVREPARDKPQDLALAVGEVGDGGGRFARVGSDRKLCDQPLVIDGAISASPPATTRMPWSSSRGPTSLSRNLLAPRES
jgi:hypothetical protein